jgi:tetratricopeptide (TPR) repeat protein
MGHDKVATYDYALSRGVDLWSAHGVHTLVHVTSTNMLALVGSAAIGGDVFESPPYAAAVGEGNYLIALLPQGPAEARRRMPQLNFQPISDPAFQEEFLTLGIAAYKDSLIANPQDHIKRQELADLLFIHEDYVEARLIYRDVAKAVPDDLGLWQKLAAVEEKLGDLPAAREALEKALQLAIQQQAVNRAAELEQELRRVSETARSGITPR